jgi:branched-subunit amino acid transport protein
MELSWTSLLPSLLAIVFAIVTRKVLLALIGGIILY